MCIECIECNLFQKDLIVWKHALSIFLIFVLAYVSEGLNSVETLFQLWYLLPALTVSEGLNSVETAQQAM